MVREVGAKMEFDQDWLLEPGFSWQKGYALALACKLTYASSTEVQRVLRERWRMGGRVFSFETQGFVAVGPKVAIVAFRGTQGLGDWMNNIDIGGFNFLQSTAAPMAALSGLGLLRPMWSAKHLIQHRDERSGSPATPSAVPSQCWGRCRSAPSARRCRDFRAAAAFGRVGRQDGRPDPW